MKDEPPLHDPHDHFVKASLGDPERMAALLKAYLPETLSRDLAWDTLHAEPGTFLDEQLRERRSDLLFSVAWRESKLFLYILFEHQKNADVRMPLRLLRYMLRIWDTLPDAELKRGKLPMMLPIVFCQAREPWIGPHRFAELIDLPETASENWLPYLPDFTHETLNLAEMDLGRLNEDLFARVALGVMRAILEPDPRRSVENGMRILAELAQAPDALAFFRLCMTYLTNAGNSIDPEHFVRQVKALEIQTLAEEAMTIADSLIEKGRQEAMTITESLVEKSRQEGRQEGQLSGERLILERLLSRRFGSMPAEFREKIAAASAAELEAWSERVLFAESLEAVFRD